MTSPLTIGLTGAHGFIGSTIQQEAAFFGDTIIPFSRHPHLSKEANHTTPQTRLFSLYDNPDLTGCDAIIHLAGEPILGRWTAVKKKKIMESRVLGTRQIVAGIAASPTKPKVLVSASGIGIYGDGGEGILDEDTPPGKGFLAEVAQAWETEALQATQYGVRVVLLRIGFVLGKNGGAMQLIRPLFATGLGGKLGSGQQWMSCIHVTDIARLALFAAHHQDLQGAINAVLPEPITNATFTQLVAKALHRSAFLPVPSWGLRLLLGELSSLLLEGQRALPEKALAAGFKFSYPSAQEAITAVL